MKKLTTLALSILALAMLAAPGASGAQRVVTRNVLLHSTGGFSSSGGFTPGTIFGGGGEMRQAGKRIGSFDSICIVASTMRAECNVTLFWKARGRVQLAGSIRLDSNTKTVSIVGGTGRFRGSRGSAVVERASKDGSRQKAHLRFVR